MTQLAEFSDDELRRESDRRHRIKMRFRRATEIVRDAATDKKMTAYQATEACEYLAAALKLSHEQFADLVLAHAGAGAFFSEWPGEIVGAKTTVANEG